ncbi:hypothetical protein LG36_2098 [Lactococcus lactis]|nr:hypothetical protein LG36_2098 [Lactococcus lactis]
MKIIISQNFKWRAESPCKPWSKGSVSKNFLIILLTKISFSNQNFILTFETYFCLYLTHE